MAKATAQQEKPNYDEDRAALERVLKLPLSKKAAVLDDALTDRISKIEGLLPDYMKGQGERLVRRAMLTFSKTEKLQQCSPASIVQCVLEAAELGFAIDGRLCYAVPYNNKKKDAAGKDFWVMEAQCQVDYKGLIAAAKRCRSIQDCWARLVHDKDEFELVEENGKTQYKWKPCINGKPGNAVGVLSVATHADGWYRVDFMPIAEIDAIERRSKSASAGFSPWQSDKPEMQKKTGLRRLLKTFSDDQGLVRLFELDDQDFPPRDAPYVPQGLPPADPNASNWAANANVTPGRPLGTTADEPRTEPTTAVATDKADTGGEETACEETVIPEATRLFAECENAKYAKVLYNSYLGSDSTVTMSDDDRTAIETLYKETLDRFAGQGGSAPGAAEQKKPEPESKPATAVVEVNDLVKHVCDRLLRPSSQPGRDNIMRKARAGDMGDLSKDDMTAVEAFYRELPALS